MSERVVHAVDIGSSKILAVSAVESEDDLRILGYGAGPSRGVEKGRIVDLDRAAAAVDYALGRMERETGVRADEVIVNLGGKGIDSLAAQGFVRLAPPGRGVRRADVLNAVEHSRHLGLRAGEEQILAMPREFRLDGERGITDILGQSGERLEVLTLIVAAPTEEMENLQQMAELTQRQLSLVAPGPVASVLGGLPRREKAGDAIFIDWGHATTSVAVIRNSAIAMVGCLPIGSSHVTNDIAYLLKTDYAEAERLKTQYACADLENFEDGPIEVTQKGSLQTRSLKREVLCEIVESRTRETAQHARKLVEAGGFSGESFERIYLSGGGAILEGCGRVWSDHFGAAKPVLTWPKFGGPHARHLGVPEASVAVGLLRFGLDRDMDEFAPVRAGDSWRDQLQVVRSFFGRGKH